MNHLTVLAIITDFSLTLILIPHCQHPEDKGTEGCSKESSPVVPHGKERRCDLNTKQHSCHNTADHTTNNSVQSWKYTGERYCRKCDMALSPVASYDHNVWTYLQQGLQSNSPPPLHRRLTASLCSSARSVRLTRKPNTCKSCFKRLSPWHFTGSQEWNRVITLTDTWQRHAEQGIAMNTIKK